MKKLLTDTF